MKQTFRNFLNDIKHSNPILIEGILEVYDLIFEGTDELASIIKNNANKATPKDIQSAMKHKDYYTLFYKFKDGNEINGHIRDYDKPVEEEFLRYIIGNEDLANLMATVLMKVADVYRSYRSDVSEQFNAFLNGNLDEANLGGFLNNMINLFKKLDTNPESEYSKGADPLDSLDDDDDDDDEIVSPTKTDIEGDSYTDDDIDDEEFRRLFGN